MILGFMFVTKVKAKIGKLDSCVKCELSNREYYIIKECYKLNGKEYQAKAMRTNDRKNTNRLVTWTEWRGAPCFAGESLTKDNGGIINGILGLSGEVGEFADMIKKWIFHNKTLDITHAKKELGDVMWYIAMICESFGWSFDEIMQMNIDKLKKRYPDGFDTEKANNRSPEDV